MAAIPRQSLAGLILALALLGASGAADAAKPLVRVHGTETWQPVLEVALDEVALVRRAEAPKPPAPPVLVGGTSVLRRGRDSIAVRVDGVATVADLVARAKELRDANPHWHARLVLYATAGKRSSRTRRLLNDEIVVRWADGTTSAERVSDPLDTLETARTLAERPGVSAAEPVAAAPDYLQQRLARKLAKLQRQDKPSERQEFFALKRLPPGERRIPVERYFQAREEMRRMPLHSTAAGGLRFPSMSELRMSAHTAAAFLGSWTPLGPGNVGGRTRALVVNPITPNVMYAGGVAGGVWKTLNGGGSWTPLTDAMLPNLAIASLDIDPTNSDVLYAGTGEGVFNGDAVRGAGIFKTADAGTTWTLLAATATDDFNFVNKIKVLGDGSTVLAATRTGLWRSQDSGTTWSQLFDTKAVNGCLDIAAGDSYVLASCGTFAQGTVYRSASAVAADGFSFTAVLGSGGKLDSSMGRTSLAIAPSNQDIVYALATSIAGGTYNQGLRAVYKSTDRGATWQATVKNDSTKRLNTLLLTNPIYATSCFTGDPIEFFNQGWYDNVIAVDPVDPDRVWAGGVDLFRSDDGGANWGLASFWWTDSVAPGAFAHADQHVIVFDPGYDGDTNQTMFVGNDGGIFKTSSARGTTTTNVCNPNAPPALTGRWTSLNNGYGVTQFYHGLPFPGPDGGDTFFGGTQDNGTILGSVADGINGWTAINGGDGGYVAVDSTNRSVLYSAQTDLSIAKSIDGGKNFADAISGISNTGFLFIAPFVMSPNNSQILWTGGNRMWRTINGAGSWLAASAPFGCGSVSAIAVAPRAGLADDSAVDQVVLAGTSGGCVFRTRTALTGNAGTVWTRATTAGTGFVSSITFDPTNANQAYLTHSTFGSVHVERSTDGGLTFSGLDGAGSALPDVPAHTIVVAPGNPNNLYVGTDVGVFSSDDGGDNWSVENTGFANVITEALAVGQVGGVDHVFAFTHGRGVFRVALPASMADVAVVEAAVLSASPVVAGRTLDVTDTVKNVGTVPASASFTVTYALVPVNAAGTPTGPDIALAESRAVSVLSGGASSQVSTSLVMPNLPAGSYKIRVMADTAGQVAEDPVPQNNTRLTSAFTLVRPDLAVMSVTPALTAAPGGSLNVTHVLRNLAPSPATAPPSMSTFYLATNQSMASVVGILGNTSAPAVTAGGTTAPITGSTNVVPPTTPPGRYFVIVQANSTAAFAEISLVNNVMAAGAAVLVGADLLVTTASATPAGVIPGGNLSVTFTAKNQGGSPATFDVGFDLIPVTAAGVPTGGAAVPLGTFGQAIVLNAGQTSAAQKTILALPPSLSIGTYKLRITTDPTNAVPEADETNNAFLVPAIITVGQPDLMVQSVTFAPLATATNGSVTVTHVVKNLGVAPGHAPTSTSRLFLGSANNSVAGAFDLGTVAVAPVSAGATQSASRLVGMPSGITPGLYFLLAVADDAGAVVESNENNNRGTSVTRLVVGPDLTVSTATAAAGVATGMNLSVSYTLRNAGGEAATNFEVGFRLVRVSATGVPTGDPEVTLGPNRVVASLGAGAMQVFTNLVLIPANTVADNFKIRVIADVTTAVTEAREGNNELLTGIVKVGRPDLTVPSVTFTPAAVAPGGNLSVTHVVKNITAVNGNAPASQSAIYLSQNASFEGVLSQLATVSVPPLASNGMTTLTRTVNVGNLSTGRYFVVVRADDPGTLIEQNDVSNNVGVSAAGLIVGPDAAVTAATTAVPGAGPGTNVSVNYMLKNLGGGATGSFNVGFDVTPVTAAGVPNGLPVELGTVRSNVGLAAGQMLSFANNAPVPADLPAGTYRIGVTVFGFSTPDANAANDRLLTSGVLQVRRPDLVVNSLSFTPPRFTAVAGNLSVTHTIRNATATIGNAPQSFSTVHLSTNQSASGIVFSYPNNVSAPSLLPGAISAAVTAVLPLEASGLPLGRYFVGVRADGPDLIVEANEANNVLFSATPFLVGPDVTLSALTITTTAVAPGGNVSGSATIANLGAAATGGFQTTFALVPINPPGPDIALSTFVFTPLLNPVGAPALSTDSGPLTFTIPSTVAPGLYAIRGMADSAFAVTEADETNNTRLSNTFSVVRADLVMSVLTPPATLIAGRSTPITNTVKNNAIAGAAPPFEVGMYFSSNNGTDTTGDTLVGVRSVTGVAGGGTNATAAAILVPSVSGNFFLKAFADHTDQVVEANESNNVTVKPVAVVPDLVRGGVTTSISFSIGGAPPTCLVSIFGSGAVLETIMTQTGGSFSGGSATFFDSQGGFNTVAFSGTVIPAGNVSGTFSLTRSGGGGGSGSGTLTGTAFPGQPGALWLDLKGKFTVSGGGTCDLIAHLVYTGNGQLTSGSVVPASLTAGATGNVTVGFTTTNPWPANGMLQIIFPGGFDPSAAAFIGASGPDGTFLVTPSGQTLTLARSGGSLFTAGSVSLTLGGIRNPGVSGATGAFSLETMTVNLEHIDGGLTAGVTITPSALGNPSVIPASLVTGASGDVTVSFDTGNPWPADGTVTIDFPAGFGVSSATFVSAFGPPGAFGIGVSGQTVTLTRSGGFTYSGGVSLTLSAIQNPAVTGTTGTFAVTTTVAGGVAIDVGTAPGVTITP